MTYLFDFHSHSTFSDGTLTPEELVKRAAGQQVEMLALTDHDTTEGAADAFRTAQMHGVEFVPGVEISVSWERNTLHIVGLNVDPANVELEAGLSWIRGQRAVRSQNIAKKLQKAGMENVLSEVERMAGTESATRTHFARYLVDNGHAKDMQAAFKKWLGRKGKAYVNGEWAGLEQAVSWIRNSGGHAVIAHPARYNFTATKMRSLIEAFQAFGGVGIEVATSSHNIQEKSAFAALAKRYNLYASAGSDFHTPGNRRIELGMYLALPDYVRPVWECWKSSKAEQHVVNE